MAGEPRCLQRQGIGTSRKQRRTDELRCVMRDGGGRAVAHTAINSDVQVNLGWWKSGPEGGRPHKKDGE